jgi:hypothetical protein
MRWWEEPVSSITGASWHLLCFRNCVEVHHSGNINFLGINLYVTSRIDERNCKKRANYSRFERNRSMGQKNYKPK